MPLAAPSAPLPLLKPSRILIADLDHSSSTSSGASSSGSSSSSSGSSGSNLNSNSSNSRQSVRVFVRVRPPLASQGHIDSCIDSPKPNSVCIANPRNSSESLNYSFDRVFDAQSSQDQVFAEVEPVIFKTLEGINTTIFAYGQTGSGKTYTINGPSTDSPGIIPRSIQSLLTRIKTQNLAATISLSYLEIYNEKIHDLLVDGPKSNSGLDLRETAGKSIVVAGLTVVGIKSMADFERYQELALKNRSTAATNLNEASSRSHFVLQLNIHISLDGGRHLSSKLHIIDLAGSEDNKRTGNVGVRMVESGAINKSLFVLGQVVEALNKGLSRVPYRDSKITRLLQDSIGGSAIGLMIACCAPDKEHYWDTYNTLNFALKSSLVRNVVVRNESIDTITQPSPVIPTSVSQSTTTSRKQELMEWRQRANKTNQTGSSSSSTLSRFQPARKQIRLSDGSTCSTESSCSVMDRSRVIPTSMSSMSMSVSRDADELSELVRAQVEEQLKERFESIRAEFGVNKPGLSKTKSTRQPLPSAAPAADPQPPQQQPHTPQELLKHQTQTKILTIINTGTLTQILTLKQVGKKRAEAILVARDVYGPFLCMDQLDRAGLSKKVIDGVLTANVQL